MRSTRDGGSAPKPPEKSALRGSIQSTALALAILAVMGCGSDPPPRARAPRRPDTALKTPPGSAAPKGPPMLPASIVAELDDEDATPYFARKADGTGLLLWSSKGRWHTRAVGADGAPKGAVSDAGPSPSQVPLASLRAVGDGYLAAWVEPVEKNHLIRVQALDAAGQARGGPVLVTQSTDELSFLDVLTGPKGTLVLWEIARGDRADVVVAPVQAAPAAKPTGAPGPIAQGVLGWEAVPTPRGAVLVTVVAPSGKEGAKLGRVLVQEVDAAGKASPPVVVSNEPTAQIDVGVVVAGGRYLVAWTDEREIDAAVWLAAVEPGGKVAVAPRRAMTPVGEQALVSMVAPSAGSANGKALCAWEDLLGAPREGRLIHLATVGSDGVLSAERATLVFSANGPPDLVADGDGFAAVTLAPAAAPAAADAPPSGDAPLWPTFVRFGADLAVRAAEPVRAAPFASTEGVPYLTRGLTCEGGGCLTLASGAGVPAPLAAVSLPVRESPWRAPAWRDAEEKAPRMAALSSIFDGEHLADVVATEIDDKRMLAAWVTYYLEGATGDGTPKKGKGGEEPLAATLGVRPIGAEGPGKTVILSQRALSIGGVALAVAPGDTGGKPRDTVLAWVAKEKGEPQVFVTKLGPDGAKLAQKKLTIIARKRNNGIVNEPADVAIAPDGEGGFIVAWSDTRDGNAEIYVAKIDRELKKTVPDKRITDAPGDSAEVQIVVRGKEAFLAWSDARESPDAGNADVYLARLDAHTLQKAAPEARLFASSGHSRTPSLASLPSGLLAAWIEEPQDEAKRAADAPAGEAGVRLAQLDDKGVVIGAPALVPSDRGAPVTSVALACGGAPRCRAVVPTAQGESLLLGALEITPGVVPAAPKTLAALSGSVTEDVSPSFAGDKSLLFADAASGGTGRVRWMSIVWP